MVRGGGQVVRILAYYSDDPSSNHPEVYNLDNVKIVVEKDENKQKRAGFAIIKKLHYK